MESLEKYDFTSRINFWISFIAINNLKKILELGVYKGYFAHNILKNCPNITDYIMLDSWRSLDNWNKPANKDNKAFNNFYQEAMDKTQFAAHKRVVLRGTTLEVSEDIKSDSVDLAYIDGDHTLRGISIDLIRMWPKVNSNGFIGGDDLCGRIWQHGEKYEPTLVFPFVIYFAEAMNKEIYLLPNNQFLINKGSTNFKVYNKAQNAAYDNLSLQSQMHSKLFIRFFQKSWNRWQKRFNEKNKSE